MLVLFVSLFVVTSLFAAGTAHWEISKKFKVIEKEAIGFNKTIALRKANEKLNLALDELEAECLDEGWKYSVLSRKEIEVRQRRHTSRKKAKVQALVVCELE